MKNVLKNHSMTDSVKWTCENCKRGFKREAYYLKHLSRESCVAEKDAILVVHSQNTSPRASVAEVISRVPSCQDIENYDELINWFDKEIMNLRESFIKQVSLLKENASKNEKKTG